MFQREDAKERRHEDFLELLELLEWHAEKMRGENGIGATLRLFPLYMNWQTMYSACVGRLGRLLGMKVLRGKSGHRKAACPMKVGDIK